MAVDFRCRLRGINDDEGNGGQGVKDGGMLFFMLLAIFCATYFGVMLPLCQRISRRVRGRRFVVRLGTPWSFSNPEHRWDVLMSFVSFIVALCVSMLILDAIFPLAEAAR